MRIAKLVLVIALTALTIGIVAAPALAGESSIPQLKKQLRHAKKVRQRTGERARTAAANLAGARELLAAADGESLPDLGAVATPPTGMSHALAAGLLADGVVTAEEVAALQARAARTKKIAQRWTVKVKNLQQRVRRLVRIQHWSRSGQWKPLIKIAGKKYGVSPAGLYRMMMLESHGNRTAGSRYKGLFQYYPGTWAGTWNPWRHHSIFDGWAQIRATAYALSKGMGRSQWPNTYRMAF